MITYEHVEPKPMIISKVYLGKKLVGWIKVDSASTYFYQPKGSKSEGVHFTDIFSVMRSIEGRE